jgi:hypothetical protein
MTTYSAIIGSPPGGSTLPSGAFGSFGLIDERLHAGRAAEHRPQIGKSGQLIKIGMHEGEILDIRQHSRLGPKADFQIGKLFREGVAPGLRAADAVVQINDEQRHTPSSAASGQLVIASATKQPRRDCRGPLRAPRNDRGKPAHHS